MKKGIRYNRQVDIVRAMKRNSMGARCQPAKGAAQTPVRLSDGGGDAKLQISTYRFADAHAPAQRGNHDLDARLN